MPLSKLDDYFPDWKEREALAEAMIPLIGKARIARTLSSIVLGEHSITRVSHS